MGAISDFLAADHDRLDALFTAACADPDRVDLGPYEEFRRDLLKHVGMEELVLFAAARRPGRRGLERDPVSPVSVLRMIRNWAEFIQTSASSSTLTPLPLISGSRRSLRFGDCAPGIRACRPAPPPNRPPGW